MTRGGGPSRKVPADCYMISQASSILGVSQDTLRQWRRSGKLKPSRSQQNGKLRIPLWTASDLDNGKKLIKSMNKNPENERTTDGVG